MTHNSAIFLSTGRPKYAKRPPQSGYVQVPMWEVIPGRITETELARFKATAEFIEELLARGAFSSQPFGFVLGTVAKLSLNKAQSPA